MSEHVTDRLALAAAGALDPGEKSRVEAHLRDCAACAGEAAEWSRLTDGLRRLPAPRPSADLVARTVGLVEYRLAQRSEQARGRAALGLLVTFAWILSVVWWRFLDLATVELGLKWSRPLGPTAGWYAAYVVVGWLTAGAAAALLGRGKREEGSIA